MNHAAATKADLLDAIASPANNVVALVGHWGVGKTYLWEEVRKDYGERLREIKSRYAYVSLFGKSDIREVRDALFSQFAAIDAEDVKRGQKSKNALFPYVEKIQRLVAQSDGLWKIGAEAMGAAIELMKLTCIHDMLVCFDDFERAADELKAAQILGLIDELTTRRRCKVLLILNDAKLGSETSTVEEYRERVIDKTVRFEPSYSYALEAAVPNNMIRTLMEPHIRQLGCRNIRVIRKMLSTIGEIERRSGCTVDQKTPGVISAICLLTYCYLVRDAGIPTVEDVLKEEYVSVSVREDDKPTPASTFLRKQNWQFVDKCDRLIGELISHGLCDWGELNAEIQKHSTEVSQGQQEQEIRVLWRDWRTKFLDKTESLQFAHRIVDTTKRNIAIVNAREIDDTCDLLKTLLSIA